MTVPEEVCGVDALDWAFIGVVRTDSICRLSFSVARKDAEDEKRILTAPSHSPHVLAIVREGPRRITAISARPESLIGIRCVKTGVVDETLTSHL